MTPRLTLGLIAGELRNRAERSLEHLLRQTALDQIEIVVIDVPVGCPVGSEQITFEASQRPSALPGADTDTTVDRSPTPLCVAERHGVLA